MHSATTLGASQSGVARTPETDDDVVLAGLDTHQLRNAVQQRLFGGAVDPVRIGRFPILRRLGQGGMGVVFAAYDNELDRKIAIKLLHGGHVGENDENARARLLREAKALARLSHPSVVQVYEAGEHEGRVYLAMEFVEGVTLREWASKERLPTAEILAKYTQAGRGLAAAHAAGLVHRDFKPDNAIVSADGRVRVLDFGLALATLDRIEDLDAEPARPVDDPRLTHTGAMLGTPLYMAPEQFLGRHTDARTDQFSFAVALFEALYGERPFAGDTVHELSVAVIEGRMRPSSTRRLPKHIVRALRRALALEPEDRFEGMDTLLTQLERPSTVARSFGVAGTLLAGLAIVVLNDADDSELTAQVDAERSRADEAERALRERESTVLLSEAGLLVHEDPTRALQMLAQLDASDDAWSGPAWDLAATAADAGVAREVIPLPSPWRATRILADGDVLVSERDVHGSTAIFDPDTGSVETIGHLRGEDGVQVSGDGRWILRRELDEVVLHDRTMGVDHTLISESCMMANMWGPNRVLAVCDDLRVSAREGAPRAYRWFVDEQGEFHSNRLTVDENTTPFGDPLVRILGANLNTIATSSDGIVSAALDDGLLWIQHRDGEAWSVDVAAHTVAAWFSPDARWLALVTSGAVLLVSARDPDRPVERITRILDARMLGWAPDSQKLYVIGKDDTIALWDLRTGRTTAELRGLKAVDDAGWRPDGTFEALGEGELRRWPAPHVERLADEVLSVDARAGGRASLFVDGRIVRVDRSGVEHELPEHDGAEEILLLADGSLITSGLRHLRLTNADGMTSEFSPTRDQFVEEMAADATGKTFAWIDEGRVNIVDLETRQQRHVVHNEDYHWEDLEFDPESGELWLVEDPYYTGPDVLRRVDPRTLASLGELALPEGEHTALAALPGGRLALATGKGTIEIVDVHTGDVSALRSDGDHILRLAATADGRTIAALRVDGTVDLWNTLTGSGHVVPKEQASNALPATSRQVSPSRRVLAFDGNEVLLDVDGAQRLRSYRLTVPHDPAELHAWANAATTGLPAPVR